MNQSRNVKAAGTKLQLQRNFFLSDVPEFQRVGFVDGQQVRTKRQHEVDGFVMSLVNVLQLRTSPPSSDLLAAGCVDVVRVCSQAGYVVFVGSADTEQSEFVGLEE